LLVDRLTQANLRLAGARLNRFALTGKSNELQLILAVASVWGPTSGIALPVIYLVGHGSAKLFGLEFSLGNLDHQYRRVVF